MSRPIPELLFQGTQHTLKTHICCQGAAASLAAEAVAQPESCHTSSLLACVFLVLPLRELATPYLFTKIPLLALLSSLPQLSFCFLNPIRPRLCVCWLPQLTAAATLLTGL